jgi:D-alanine--D-alanine ligase
MKKLRVGVLMGGKSIEKEVSFNSGRTICDHLDTNRYAIVPLYQKNNTLFLLPWHFLHRGKTTDFEHRLAQEASAIAWDDLKKHIDFIYIAQHGRYAEDGILQGFLEILNIPYLGSGVLASALRMDKIAHKTFLHNAGITTPRHITIEPHEIDDFTVHKQQIMQKLVDANIHDHYVVKPYNEGSSLGVSIVSEDGLESALQKACSIENGKRKRVLIEEKVNGMEFTCIIVTDYKTGDFFALPPTEIIPEAGTTFFDYEQKYMPGRGTKHTPARCSTEIIDAIQQTCLQVMHALKFTTMGRIDGFVTPDNTIVIIDPNTLSGMAPSSFIFNQAAEINMSPTHIINHIIETELHQYGMLENILEQEKCESKTMHTAKKRIALLIGGRSDEKETSLDSGRNVFYKLNRHTYDPIPLFVDNNLELYHLTQAQLVRNSTTEITALLDQSQKIKWNDLPTIADFVFIALHGGEGENGAVQGTLEMLGLPYNGSSVLASALCMNKHKANQLFAAHGFHVPRNTLITKEQAPDIHDIVTHNSFIQECLATNSGLIAKPHDDGCSVMVQKITTQAELISAISLILEHKQAALIEEYIVGMELTVGVVGNDNPSALPPSQAVATNGILTIEEKFLPGAGENQTPAPLPQDALTLVQRTVENAYKTAGCKGYARIDCFYQTAQQSPTGNERVVILEVNTLPGMTPATCLFHQAAEIGLRPSAFIDTIITLGFEEHATIQQTCMTKESETTR